MKGRLRSVLSQLRHVIGRHGDGGLSDGQLLERFVRQRDEAAFEVLVWRHGPMVLGVGHRLLHNREDAEDVLQAAFLALVRQARSIERREALASWLYKVAYRLALRARQQRQKRSLGQVAIEEVAAPPSCGCDRERDDLSLLDEELQRLPEKYRIPLVLSYLEGLTNQGIAAQLSCPIGTVFTRLARGRELLRKRLVRRGVTLSVGLAGATLAGNSAMAALQVELVRATIRAARAFAEGPGSAACVVAPNVVALAEGVEKMMGLSRWWFVGATSLLLMVLGSGAGLLAWRGAVREPEKTPARTEIAAQPSKAPAAQAEAAGQDAPPQAERERPKVVQVFPADGSTDVQPITEIRIRFDWPMDRTRAVLNWEFRSQAGFRPRSDMRYDETTHEFILPVQLSPGRKHEVTVNRQSFTSAKENDYEGFQSKEHVAAKPYRWSFTTKKPAAKEGKRPRLISLSPPSDTEVSLLTPLEVTFDQPMDPSSNGLSFDGPAGSDRVPKLLGQPEYDPAGHRFTLLLGLPANWNGQIRLEGFRDKNGVEAEPILVKYRTQRSVHSEALRKRIEQAGQSDKLSQLVERVRKARRDLRSVSEEALLVHSYSPFPYWYQTFEIQGSRFQMQGEQKYLGIIDGIMHIPFRVGSDGKTCWLRRDNERITLAAKEIKEKNLLFCDAFHSAGTEDAKRVIQDMKLEYLGEAVVRGRRCHRLRSWVVELSSFDSLSPIREWYIDTETLLPLRVETAGVASQTIDYSHSRVNQPIPDKEFSPDTEPGVKAVDAEPLAEGYTLRFLNVVDGSNGRMSVRWGEKGPKGTRSGGLN